MEKRGWRTLFFLYCLFITYGTLIPFDATTDPSVFRRNASHFWKRPIEHGRRTFSIPDVVSNVSLFVTLGFFWVAWRSRSISPRVAPIIQSGVIGLILGGAVETYQLFTPTRTASSLDIWSNGSGAVLGAAGALMFFSARCNRQLKQLIRNRPQSILLVLLALALMADGFYPYEATLDVGTILHALRQIKWPPFQDLGARFWSGTMVERLFFFALFSILFGQLWQRSSQSRFLASCAAFSGTSAFALWLEASKIFFVGRVPNLTNVAFAVLGAALVFVVVPKSGTVQSTPTALTRPLLWATTFLIIFLELAPFDWNVSPASIQAKVGRIEWLPFWSYYAADATSAAFDFGKKMLCLGTFGFLVTARRSERRGDNVVKSSLLAEAVVKAVALGVVLESAQLLLRTRTTSTTDVLLFGLGAAMGGLGYRLYRKLVISPSPIIPTSPSPLPLEGEEDQR